jgi:predicted nucleic acid-binding protein
VISVGQAGYVADASVLVKWFLHRQEADRDRALALRDHHVSGRSVLFVPALALLEILNAVRNSHRGKKEDGELAAEILRDLHLRVLPIEFDLLIHANAIAWIYAITIYDALYVALAEQLGIPLITADDVMTKKLKGHPAVVPLREIELSEKN